MDASDQLPTPFVTRRRVLLGFDVAMAVAAAAAISSLALEYGFYGLPPGVPLAALHAVEAAVLGVFVLNRLAHLLLRPDRRGFLRENWVDFAVLAAVLAAAGAVRAGWMQFTLLPAAALYVVIIQVYILAALVVRTVGFQLKVAASGIHPAWTLIGSFAVVILFGAGLLMLPKAAPAGRELSVTDALFTATSATCVTGLIVRDTGSDLTTFGQGVVLSLIQLGGLGIMIFGTLFALLAGRGLSVRESLLAGQVLSEETVGRAGRMVKFVVLVTFAFEAVGAVLMYPMWRSPADGAVRGAYHSVFHAVSAFCNAGFCLRGDSLTRLRDHWGVIGVMAPLIVLGGLGFPVLYDAGRAAWRRLGRLRGRAGPGPGLGLHTKMVLATSAVLLVAGAAGLIVLEGASDPGQTYGSPLVLADNPQPRATGSSLNELPPARRVREAVFQSVTARTAGFNTVEMDRLSPAGKLWVCLLMLIGGSPASTAGGMKTVTFGVLVLGIWSVLRRRERIEGFRRSIAEGFLRKAVSLAGLYLALVAAVTLLLCVTMHGRRLADGRIVTFMQLLFESCSACGTVGLTCGVTERLTVPGRYVIMAAMFVGRLGPLTLLMALTLRVRPARYTYPNEEVILG